MTRRLSLLPLPLGLGLGLALSVVSPQQAGATFSSGGSGSSGAMAYTMPAGAQATAGVSGSSVTVRWPAAVFPDNLTVAGYIVRRYDAASGSPATVGAGCAGTVTGTTCTESNVPAGNWYYTDSPVEGRWSGGTSPPSAAVTVP